ncbi:3-hydroxyacyl-CoA dehydrogenase/enoyl-CoA hydratase family protein [Sneathiella sp. CAU 1612]|uniref:3-hydroxyacyl-CoA dehydrogenase/enoyl-CoA hydratase family protein n=1 Tax=Sneathiella sedimenti TaxID=2816034 RepID=A0ABS3F1C9_9PROT|nr:3-hydroxyacyl-CoA dehydrogenase/enoyl-CoA hydratase family protein [Sneathiella sedimenti]MBO0332309.1 3-hydroxyacyl-CoA dehydrogenase/enoyl-CoA hydratase family protein [Sneathiella sedimenti]
MAIEKVAVIGAGVMGAAIAAHVANAGVPVVLLDIVPKDAKNRNMLAEGAVATMLKTKPAPFMHKKNARLVTTGNLEDNLDLVADCDWICEAIIENTGLKQDLYTRLDDVRKDGSIITSNTSTIPLKTLMEGMPESLQKDFAITHFFNPPRYMRLFELVGGDHTRKEALEDLRTFADISLGKEVVDCYDTPGFVGNRIGIYWSSVATRSAYDLDLTVEEADAVCGKPMGIPSTGIFGLGDLTGIDLGPKVIASMLSELPESDAFAQEYDANHPLVAMTTKMIEEGYTGRKGKGGFYRMNKEDGKRVKEARNLKTGEYAEAQKPQLGSVKAAKKGLRALVEYDDKGGQYAWAILSKTISYAASLVSEIADDIIAIDTAMKTGYAWKYGPFEQLNQLGNQYFIDRLEAEDLPVPEFLKKVGDRPLYKEEGKDAFYMTVDGDYAVVPVPEGAWMLADIKRGNEPVLSNKGASIWDLGDGVACLEIHTKMNSIDQDVVAMLVEAGKIDKKGFKALIIGNDADNFSVGANVGLALFAANAAMWPVIENSISEGQNALMKLKYAPFPVVAAPAGMALGGGCEIVLAAAAVQAHAESYMGLVEVGVGVIPGFGGCKELVMRAMLNKKRPGGAMPALSGVFEAISTAKVATSAAEARDMMILREGDRVTMNRKRVLADAKKRALEMVEGYAAPEPVEVNLPGETAAAAFDMAVSGFVTMGRATAYDGVVSEQVARVLTGGDTDITQPVTEKKLLQLEREGFMTLIHNHKTLDRIEHMLTTGKPLRN